MDRSLVPVTVLRHKSQLFGAELRRGPRIALKSCSSDTGKKSPCFPAARALSGLFIIRCRAKAFLQLGLGDNQHSFLLKPGLQNRPLSSGSPPHHICPRPPEPGLPCLASASKRATGALKSRKSKYLGSEMKARIVTPWQMDLPRTACGRSIMPLPLKWETEVQRRQVTCPRSHSKMGAKTTIQLRLLPPAPLTLPGLIVLFH